jgi:hypothetical protein
MISMAFQAVTAPVQKSASTENDYIGKILPFTSVLTTKDQQQTFNAL